MEGLECIGLLGLVVAAIVLAVIATNGDGDEGDFAVNKRGGDSSFGDEALLGNSRTRPLPKGHAITHNDLSVTVLDVSYSTKQNGSFASLEENHVWAVVTLRLEAIGDPNKAFGYNTVDFRLVGDRGAVYNGWMEAPKSDMGSGEFFGGASLEANIVRQVHEEDENMVLIFSPALKESRFFALESNPQNGSRGPTNSAVRSDQIEDDQGRTKASPPPIPVD